MVYYSVTSYNSDMFLANIMSWWYSNGLKRRLKIIENQFISTADFFSIGLLATTLFAPFRQISVGDSSGPIAVQMRAFFDKLISRFVGFFVRFSMMIIGILILFLQGVFSSLVMIVWLAAPLAPVIGLVLCVIGVVPKW